MSGSVAAHLLEDPFEFAQGRGTRRGELAFAEMPRLQDRLSGGSGPVIYTVAGSMDPRDRPVLELAIDGLLPMRCDRCLMPLDFPLALRSVVLLARPGAVPADDDDPLAPDWVEAGRALDMLELVEDEILLGLPYSVRHEDGRCGNAGKAAGRRKDSPFSVLSALRAPGQTDND